MPGEHQLDCSWTFQASRSFEPPPNHLLLDEDHRRVGARVGPFTRVDARDGPSARVDASVGPFARVDARVGPSARVDARVGPFATTQRRRLLC